MINFYLTFSSQHNEHKEIDVGGHLDTASFIFLIYLQVAQLVTQIQIRSLTELSNLTLLPSFLIPIVTNCKTVVNFIFIEMMFHICICYSWLTWLTTKKYLNLIKMFCAVFELNFLLTYLYFSLFLGVNLWANHPTLYICVYLNS